MSYSEAKHIIDVLARYNDHRTRMRRTMSIDDVASPAARDPSEPSAATDSRSSDHNKIKSTTIKQMAPNKVIATKSTKNHDEGTDDDDTPPSEYKNILQKFDLRAKPDKSSAKARPQRRHLPVNPSSPGGGSDYQDATSSPNAPANVDDSSPAPMRNMLADAPSTPRLPGSPPVPSSPPSASSNEATLSTAQEPSTTVKMGAERTFDTLAQNIEAARTEAQELETKYEKSELEVVRLREELRAAKDDRDEGKANQKDLREAHNKIKKQDKELEDAHVEIARLKRKREDDETKLDKFYEECKRSRMSGARAGTSDT